jgi:hypothetical protein
MGMPIGVIPSLSRQEIAELSGRLCLDSELQLPANLTRGRAPDATARQEYLENLLSRDAGGPL